MRIRHLSLVMHVLVGLVAFSSDVYAIAIQAYNSTTSSYVTDTDSDSKYVVAIKSGNAWCSGSIISSDTILTAAHCFAGRDKGASVVIFGTGPLYNDKYKQFTVVRSSQTLINPLYHKESRNNRPVIKEQPIPSFYVGAADFSPFDVALIRLEHPIPADYHPVTLASSPPKRLYAFDNLFSLGYGQKFDEKRRALVNDDTLKKKIYPGYIYNDGDARIKMIDEGDNYSTCYGDSGGPLLVKDDDQVYQIGIGSGVEMEGASSCKANSIFTSTLASYDWIRSAMVSMKSNNPIPARENSTEACVKSSESEQHDNGVSFILTSITNSCANPVRCVENGWYQRSNGSPTDYAEHYDLSVGAQYSYKLVNVARSNKRSYPSCYFK